MNVFVLGTGRCGTHTFVRASEHMTNFSAGHQSRDRRFGPDRLAFPDQHVEADQRLCWLLGELDEAYGDHAYYVHLERDSETVAKSYSLRWHGIGHMAPAYRDTLIGNDNIDRLDASRAFVETMKANIRMFLKDKSNVMHIRLETAAKQYPEFWNWIGAEGDLQAAMAEWGVRHGASLPPVKLAAKSVKARAGKALRAAFPK